MSNVSCVECRGRLLSCGRKYCPVLALKSQTVYLRTDVDGASPPAVFVGRLGYPKVFVGPLVPPVKGDTSILDFPERWFGRGLNELIQMRRVLIRGMKPLRIKDVWCGLANELQELALSSKSPDVEMKLERAPSPVLRFSEIEAPFGPSASMLSMKVGSTNWHPLLEKVYADVDLSATEGMLKLYKGGAPVSAISKALSVGALGRGPLRRFVPTRWAITATDDTIGKAQVAKIKHFETIDKPRVYYLEYLDNRWVAVMFPRKWMYELIEAWFPGSTWNMYGKEPSIVHDWEGYNGRKEYARIGGCYYAARLASAEALMRENRQAAVLIMRESHEGYSVPIGVWNVRESVRAMLKQPYQTFESEISAINYAFSKMTIPSNRWIQNSGVLKQILFQKTLDDFAT
ncbi:MAG: Nre family DNA repair protein [Candidatus Korarchaeota archaeon]